MRFVKDEETGVIKIYRNKRKLLTKVKEEFKNEDGCIACSLFDVCLDYGGGDSSACEKMVEAGVVRPDEKGDRFFVNVWKNKSGDD